MRIIRLYDKEGKPMIGSDSIMKIDGRFGNIRTQLEIQERNARYRKNFPHLVAYFFNYTGLQEREHPKPRFKVMQSEPTKI